MIGKILCMLGRHERSRRHVHHNGADFLSICRHCRSKMYKDLHKGWIVIPTNETT